MNSPQYGESQLFEAFIRSAQYFVRLNTQQDVWDHMGKFITTYFPADWIAFVERDNGNAISVHYCTLPDAAAAQRILTDEVRALTADVLESGFLATQVILTPAPSMTVFLPIVEEYQTEKVMLIGHKTADPLPNDLLNIYLALAGLASTTLERLHNERELNGHRAHLEELVKERTAELAKAKRQNELILHSVGEGICGIDLVGRITFVNPFAAQTIGWDPSELIGRNAHATFHHTRSSGCPYPSERCPVHSALRNGGAKYATDEEFLRKDKTRFPVEFTTAPIMEEGNITGAVIVFRDISARKAAEEELHQQREWLRVTLTSIGDAVMATDASGCIIFQNPVAVELTGWPLEEALGQPIQSVFRIINEDTRAAAEDIVGRVIREGHVVSLANHTSLIARDGREIPVEDSAAPIMDSAGNMSGVVLVFHDVTEKRRAQQRLRENEERLRLAVESAGLGTWDYDPVTEKLNWSDRCKAVFGLAPDAPVDYQTFLDRLHPEDRKRVHELMQQALDPAGSGRYYTEYRSLWPDNTLHWIIATGRAFFGTAGGQHRAIRFIGTVLDVTERKRMENELRAARRELELRVQERTAELSEAKENLEVINEELQVEISEHEKTEKELMAAKETAEAAVDAKAAFLANMSHELRTPMNAVIGFSSLLLDDNLTPEQKDYVESIRKGGEALLAVISDILEFSRSEKEKVELEHQPLSLKHCIKESLDMVAVQAIQKGLNLAYTINYGTPDTIMGDHGKLRRILVNLLSNAVKFTDQGGVSVSISCKAVDDDMCQILFAVEDTGIGIPQDKRDQLFQPFGQVECIISRKRDGAGLGLAICKKLVELMGGEIWAESEPGRGSTFRFTVRAEVVQGKHLDQGETGKDRDCRNVSGQKPMSILVAEDNPSNQKVIVEMLKSMGYRPDAVADGREVLQALEIRPYDLILMDIKMPEMDGLTAARVIRKLQPHKGPRIIAITAFAMEGDRERCLEVGMDDYISKPVKVSELAKMLSKYQPS